MGNRRVVVTGGTGFIGRHLCGRLAARRPGDTVVAVGRTPPAGPIPGVEFTSADVTDPSAVRDVLAGADTVVHLAAATDVPAMVRDPEPGHAVNVHGTLNVLEAARIHGVSRVLVASSSRVLGRPDRLPADESAPMAPVEPYGRQKAAAEDLCRTWHGRFGVPVVVVRPSLVYGPGRRMREGSMAGVVARFAGLALAGRPLTVVGDGRQRSDFVYVDDVVDGMIRCLEAPGVEGEVFQLASGRATSINELLAAVEVALGRRVEVQRLPASSDTADFSCAIDRARERFGYRPVTGLAEGLERYLVWLRTAGEAVPSDQTMP